MKHPQVAQQDGNAGAKGSAETHTGQQDILLENAPVTDTYCAQDMVSKSRAYKGEGDSATAVTTVVMSHDVQRSLKGWLAGWQGGQQYGPVGSESQHVRHACGMRLRQAMPLAVRLAVTACTGMYLPWLGVLQCVDQIPLEA